MEAKSNEALDKAFQDIQEGGFSAAIEAANTYVNDPDAGIRLTALTVLAIAHFRDGSYAEATQFYKQCADMSDDIIDWFNVCTSATLAGDFTLGATAYQKATALSRDSKTLSGAQIAYYYAQALADRKQFKTSLEVISTLKELYKNLHITDTHFLYTRGVPLLSQVLDVLNKIHAGAPDQSVFTWLDEVSPKLDEDGVEEIEIFKKGLAESSAL